VRGCPEGSSERNDDVAVKRKLAMLDILVSILPLVPGPACHPKWHTSNMDDVEIVKDHGAFQTVVMGKLSTKQSCYVQHVQFS